MNISIKSASRGISDLFRLLSHPMRVRIILAIGEGEACVCHLEAALGSRQAYISQHLMAMRQAGILEDRREGRFIFYRLKNPEVLRVVRAAAAAQKINLPETVEDKERPLSCTCPKCTGDFL